MAKSKARRQAKSPNRSVAKAAPAASWLLHPAVRGALLLLCTFLVYAPAWNGQPIWDDRAHLVRAELQSLGGLDRIWTELGATQQYYPLVHSLFWLEQRLWGYAPLPYHLLNILLHGISALLLLRLLQDLRIRGAWLAAAIFALHPVQVESVAWISELKNTLSGVFFFGSFLFYWQFDQSRRGRFYALALGAFALGLLCKTVIATMPAALLVLFWWKRGRLSWKQDVWPLLPFFALGIGGGLFTAWVERTYIGAQGGEFQYGLIERGLIAGRAFWFYLGKLFWPADLIFVYPRWQIDGSVAWQDSFPGMALLFFAGLFALRGKSRAPLAAFLAFAGMLFPVLGFLNVFPFIYSFVADHFQYLACVPVIILFSAGAVRLGERFRLKAGPRSLFATALLMVLATLTWQQSRIYKDAETLYRATIERNPDCWMAHLNLGLLLKRRGDLKGALEQYQETLQERPQNSSVYSDLGDVLGELGRPAEARTYYTRGVAPYRQALAERPNDPVLNSDFGSLLLQIGRVDEAVVHLEKAIASEPRSGDAQTNLGNALLQAGRAEEAISHYEKAVELWKYHSRQEQATAEYNLANALSLVGRTEEAITHYGRSLELQPSYAEAHNNLAAALLTRHRWGEALAHYEKAEEASPRSVLIVDNLAWELATSADPTLRNGARALQFAARANELAGGRNPTVLKTLAAAYAENGQFSDALQAARAGLQLAETGRDGNLTRILSDEISLFEGNSPYHQPVP